MLQSSQASCITMTPFRGMPHQKGDTVILPMSVCKPAHPSHFTKDRFRDSNACTAIYSRCRALFPNRVTFRLIRPSGGTRGCSCNVVGLSACTVHARLISNTAVHPDLMTCFRWKDCSLVLINVPHPPCALHCILCSQY